MRLKTPRMAYDAEARGLLASGAALALRGAAGVKGSASSVLNKGCNLLESLVGHDGSVKTVADHGSGRTKSDVAITRRGFIHREASYSASFRVKEGVES